VRPYGAALLVCGHTHGGHIALPNRPLVVPGRVGQAYPCGLFDIGLLRLFVSRGVGGIEAPLRTYACPDVAIFELVAAGPESGTLD
jgi:predicted MPP superfamily phosphohydrolase